MKRRYWKLNNKWENTTNSMTATCTLYIAQQIKTMKMMVAVELLLAETFVSFHNDELHTTRQGHKTIESVKYKTNGWVLTTKWNETKPTQKMNKSRKPDYRLFPLTQTIAFTVKLYAHETKYKKYSQYIFLFQSSVWLLLMSQLPPLPSASLKYHAEYYCAVHCRWSN